MKAYHPMPTAARSLIPAAQLFFLILLLAIFVLKALVPGWQALRSDFPNYYLVARLLREHYAMGRIYDWIWLQRMKDHWSIQQPLVGFVGLTPFSALPIVPLTWLDAMEAKRVWLMINLVVLAVTLFGLRRITSLGLRRIALIALLAIIPLRNNFLLGQMHLVVLGLLVLAYWLNARKMWFSSGIVLAVAASLKVYPLFFVFYFLRKRQWKPAIVLAGSAMAIFATCFLIFGQPAMRSFVIEQFPRMLRGEATDPFSLTAPSGSSFFHRALLAQPLVNPHPIFSSPILYSLLYPLWQLSLFCVTLLTISPKDGDPKLRGLEWASWICLLLALSTEPASYHFIVLAFVAILAFDAIHSAWHRAILLGCYFVACNIYPSISFEHPPLALFFDFLPYWGRLGMLACLLAALNGIPFASLMSWRAWPQTRLAWTLASLVVLWCVISATTYAHARSLVSSEYLANNSSAAFAQFAPHQAGGHLLTVAMFLQGYRVEDEVGRQYQTRTDGKEEEQLAIASSPRSNQVWIEAVTEGESRLVELSVPSRVNETAPIAIIPNAESPALSPDGRSLVFLREVGGAGRAWMVHLDENGRVLDAPLPVTPEKMNVSDAVIAGPSAVLFSATENGVPHLFATHYGETPSRIYEADDAMDSPTVNTGKRLLVYRRRSGSYWHLFAADLSRGSTNQLTFGDCNAYDPTWSGDAALIYISDCGSGIGLGALAISHLDFVHDAPGRSPSPTISTNRSRGDAQQ